MDETDERNDGRDRQRDVARLIDWVELEIEKADALEAADLARAREGLIEALSALSGFSPEQIEEALADAAADTPLHSHEGGA